MDLVLSGLQWAHCLVYLDDVIILGRSFKEHLQNLRLVLQRLREAGLKVKPSKCAFLQREVQYLGHIVSRDGISPDPSKTDKVTSWPTPTTTKDMQRFLGLSGYYRRFVKGYATIAKPFIGLQSALTNSFGLRSAKKCSKISVTVLRLPLY